MAQYNRALGYEAATALPALTALDACAPVDALLEELRTEGGLVLKGALKQSDVKRLQTEHRRLLQRIAPAFADLQNREHKPPTCAAPDLDSDESFYKGEVQFDQESTRPLRLRKTAQGRFDLKSLDKRDCGPFLRQEFPDLPFFIDQVLLPPIVRTLLQRSMGTPWRVMRVGSLPTLPGATVGDVRETQACLSHMLLLLAKGPLNVLLQWHRDIGEGLFGESFDLQLPDYYFNALIPLDPTSNENGTELVLRSHTTTTKELSSCRRAVAAAQLGDVIFCERRLSCLLPASQNRAADFMFSA